MRRRRGTSLPPWKRRYREFAPHAAVALVAIAPLFLNGATAPMATVVGVLAIVALGLAMSAGGRPGVTTGAAWLGVTMLLLTALALLPVPCGWLSTLGHPERAELGSRALALLGDHDGLRCRIAVDPGGTERATATAASSLAALLVGTLIARLRGSSFVLGAVGFGAAAVAAVTYAHAAFGLSGAYGLYVPSVRGLLWTGPVMNGNHLGGLMALGVPGALALARRTDRAPVRALAAIAAALAIAMGLSSRSRGGATATLFALVVSAIILVRDVRRSGESRRTLGFILGMLVVPAMALLAFIEGDALIRAFREKPYKTQLIRDTLAFALEQGPFGVGRGGFAAAYAEHTAPFERATYPENLVAQWLSELGPALGTLAIVAFGLVLVRVVRSKGARTTEKLGVTAVVLLTLQNLVDYSLEMPGTAVLASMVLGAVTARMPSWLPDQPGRHARVSALPAMIAALVSLVAVPVALRDDLQRQLHARMEARGPRSLTAQAYRPVIEAHPLEPSVYVVAASSARRLDAPTTLGFVNLARRAAPSWTAPRVEAYFYLSRHGRTAQALGEVSALANVHVPLAARTYCVAPPHPFDVTRMLRALPEEGAGEFIRYIAGCLTPEDRLALVEAAYPERPHDVRLATMLVLATSEFRGNEAAVSALATVRQAGGQHAEFDHVEAELAMRRSDPSSALAAVDRARAARRSSPELDSVEARAAASLRDAARMNRALARLEAGAGTSAQVATVARLRASCELTAGRPDRAIAAYEEALASDPAPDLLFAIADLAAREGRALRARAAVRRLCRDYPDSHECHEAPRIAPRP